MYDADMNVLPGGKLVLQFVAKYFTDEQGKLDSVVNFCNSVLETDRKMR